MRVLIVVPFAFHRESGSSLSTYYRVRAIADNNINTTVLTVPHGIDFKHENIRIIRTPKKSFFETYQPGEYRKKIVYEFFLFTRTIALLSQEKYDIVILHEPNNIWGVLLKLFRNLKLIATVHGNLEVDLEKWGITKLKWIKWVASKFENVLCSFYDLLICEHQSVVDFLLRGSIDKNKIKLIRISTLSVPLIDAKKSNKGFKVLYTGSFVKVQNLELIYKTAELLRNENITFWIMGGIEKEIQNEEFLIKKYNTEDKVKIFSRRSQDELLAFYQKANIVISPRTFGHDTPMKIFDYMNYGKCILATKKPIHSEILNKNNSYLVDDTPEEFAKAILFLKDDPSLVEKLGKRAKKDFEANYSFEKMKNLYKDLLQKLINKKYNKNN